MTYTGVRRPTNKIVAGGTPLVQELRVQTVANVYPGRLVKAGSSVDEIVVNDASDNINVLGWVGYEQTNPNYRPSTPTTIQVVEDQVAVLNGGGFVILAASTGSISKGNPVMPAADGKVKVMGLADMDLYVHVGWAEDAASGDKVLVRSVI